jgi:hypothetical protein
VLVGVGGIYLATANNKDTPNNVGAGTSPTPSAAAPTSAKATGKLVKIDCQPKAKLADALKRDLERSKMKVTIEDRPTAGVFPNGVVAVEPCGNVPEGSAVTIYANRGKIDNNNSAEPSNPAATPSRGEPNASATCEPPKRIIGGICVPG